MKLSFQEKSIALSLLSTLIIFGYYFFKVFALLAGAQVNSTDVIALLITVVVFIIVVEIVLHIALAVAHKPEKGDERDAWVELKATRIAYYVLTFGVMFSVFSLLLSTTLVFANTILFFFILSDVVKHALQLIYYHRGA